jgi:hypothetical protein
MCIFPAAHERSTLENIDKSHIEKGILRVSVSTLKLSANKKSIILYGCEKL